jgi:signal transduction histidine kinase
MQSKVEINEKRSIFKRKTLLLNACASSPRPRLQREQPSNVEVLEQKISKQIPDQEVTALVINSSQEMAKEITLQLTLSIPGCSIMYAPTIDIAKWILTRRRVNLVVSSPLLPDGSIARLQGVLEKMEQPADLVVVGNLNARSAEILSDSAYHCTALRRFHARPAVEEKPRPPLRMAENKLKKNIQSLGADIRNDLNNPLQEIVAMVFVARTGAETSPASDGALDAIERAAKNMSKLVNALEEKIRDAVVVNAR